MENQPTYSERITQAAKVFSAFGTPEKIIFDGEDITAKIAKDFGGVEKWLRRLAVAFNNFNITAFTITRFGGVVKLCVKSIYWEAESENVQIERR